MSQLENILTIGAIAIGIAAFINLISIKLLIMAKNMKEEAIKEREESINFRKIALEERIASGGYIHGKSQKQT